MCRILDDHVSDECSERQFDKNLHHLHNPVPAPHDGSLLNRPHEVRIFHDGCIPAILDWVQEEPPRQRESRTLSKFGDRLVGVFRQLFKPRSPVLRHRRRCSII